MKPTRYEPTRSTTNKRLWTIRAVMPDGPNIVHGYTRFSSKAKAQDWCNRLNDILLTR